MHHPITTHLITTHATTQDPGWTPISILTLILGLAVTAALWEGHAQWLATPGRGGRDHVDNPMRRLAPKTRSMPEGWIDEYYENWEQISVRRT